MPSRGSKAEAEPGSFSGFASVKLNDFASCIRLDSLPFPSNVASCEVQESSLVSSVDSCSMLDIVGSIDLGSL